MHPDLICCLAVLAAARLLTLAAVPATLPARPAPTGRSPSDQGPRHDQLTEQVAVTRPPRLRPRSAAAGSAAAGAAAPARPAPPRAAADPDRSPAADRSAPRPTRRGVRSRQRGSRGGRIWRRGDRPNQLCIGQLNVQSMKPKILELRHDIDQHGYDVVALCETWMKPTTPDRLIPVPGYRLLRRDRADGRGYGGVAVLVKETMTATVMKEPDQVTAGSKLESLWVRIRAGRQSIVLCSLYIDPQCTPRPGLVPI